MFAQSTFPLSCHSTETVAAGTLLLRRGKTTKSVVFVESGHVVLGIADAQGAQLDHQLGSFEGAGWLDATAAVLNLPSVVDAFAQTQLTVRRVPLADFRASVNQVDSTSLAVHAVLLDVARAHRQQTELAVSRLAKDAEARGAEWLLHQAQSSDKGVYSVQLLQRKRLIAAQLGIAPETLSRVLRHLRERSLISGSGRVVNLVDLKGLRLLAGD